MPHNKLITQNGWTSVSIYEIPMHAESINRSGNLYSNGMANVFQTCSSLFWILQSQYCTFVTHVAQFLQITILQI